MTQVASRMEGVGHSAQSIPSLHCHLHNSPPKACLTSSSPFRLNLQCSLPDHPLPSAPDVAPISSTECADGSIMRKFGSLEQHDIGNTTEATPIQNMNDSIATSDKIKGTEKENVSPNDEVIKEVPELQNIFFAGLQPIKEEGKSQNSSLDAEYREEDYFACRGNSVGIDLFHEGLEQQLTPTDLYIFWEGTYSQATPLDLSGFESVNLNEEDAAVGKCSSTLSHKEVQNEGMDIFGVKDVREAASLKNGSSVSYHSFSRKAKLGTEMILTLFSGAAMCPHPDKLSAGGEDAYFIEGTDWAGVADGVGGWAFEGIDAGCYSRELMSNCAQLAYEGGLPDPKNVLAQSVHRTRAVGTCTAVLAALDGQTLYVANVGDTGFIVVRDGEVLAKSSPMQRAFNFPYQVGSDGDDPSIAKTYEISVGKGDVLVLGTDGLYDNLYENEIVGIIQTALKEGAKPEDAAMWLVKMAHTAGSTIEGKSPFSDAAKAAGYCYSGGKLDDVAVVVSYVQ